MPVWTLSFSTGLISNSQFGVYKISASHDFGLVHEQNNSDVKIKWMLDFLTAYFFNSAV